MAMLNIRGMDDAGAERIRRAATARGLTIGEYVARLGLLHEVVRAHADAGDAGLQAELEALGLQTIHA